MRQKKVPMMKQTHEGWDGVASEAKFAGRKAGLSAPIAKVKTRDEVSRERAKKLLDKGK